MSDFVVEDISSKLWDEIFTIHWTYFETEESVLKLENRKKLEDCLKEFLCIVQHDRKFVLPETAQVLKESIQNLENFSAQNAITAFESISQYANNLFLKPWRKEYRILKMYSGFYQYEIKSNLLGAEILFETMGYRRLSEDTLILDGPICPDQVANVSRDAMTAYVELQIIKQIYTGLDAIGVPYSWLDIYHYRENCTGSASQAMKNIARSIEEKRFRSKQKALLGDNYGYMDVQPSSNYFGPSSQFCLAQCKCSLFSQALSLPRTCLMDRPNGICCVPEEYKQQSSTKANLVYNNISYPVNHNHHNLGMPSNNSNVLLSQMSHSRSLDHYREARNHNYMLPHRHSFDHQQQGYTPYHKYHHLQQQQQQHYYQQGNPSTQNFYESPYDCIDGNSLGDGSSTISYAAVAANGTAGAATTDGGGSGVMGINCNLNSSSSCSHPYNVSGNRFPLPINISNQLSAYDNLASSKYIGPQEPTYSHIPDPHMYSSVSKLPQNLVKNVNNGEDSINMQRFCQSEQIINFEDPSILPPRTAQQFGPLHPYRLNIEHSNYLTDNHCNMRESMQNSFPPPSPTNCQQQCSMSKTFSNDMYMYAKPAPREIHKQNAINIREYPNTSKDRGDATDISNESANDDFCNPPNGNEWNQLNSSTQFKRNQDGSGTSELCNIVCTKEQNHYSKDPSEREDLVHSLESLHINNDTSPSQSSSAEMRRSYYSANENITNSSKLESKQKNRTTENEINLAKNGAKTENSVSANYSINNTQKKETSADNSAKKMKSTLKQTTTTSKFNTNINKTQPKTTVNKTSKKINNNNNNEPTNSGNGSKQRKKSSSVINHTNKSESVTSTSASPLSTQNVVTGVNEWNCPFCTFLNTQNERICEICCHSRDFVLDSSTTSTATGGATLTHNTPTCA